MLLLQDFQSLLLLMQESEVKHTVSEQAPSAHKQVAGMAQDQKEGEVQVFPSILHKLRAANPTTRAPVLCLALGRCSQMLLS